MAKQFAFYFNSSQCSGCKACQMACKDKHDLGVGLIWRRVYEISEGDWEKRGGALIRCVRMPCISFHFLFM